MLPLVQVMSSLGDPRTFGIGAEALAVLEPLPPGPERVGALIEVARAGVLSGDTKVGVRDADRAIALAEEIGIPVPARALGYRGLGRSQLGDVGGLDDLREALRLAIESGQSREAATLFNNLGRAIWVFEGPDVALAIYREGIAFDRARGIAGMAVWCEGSSLDVLVDRGELDEAIEAAHRVAAAGEATELIPPLITARVVLARIHALRGEVAETPEDLEWMEATARGTGVPEVLVQAGAAALVWATLGRADRAVAILGELASDPRVGVNGTYAAWLPTFVRAALAIDERALAGRLASALRLTSRFAEHTEAMTSAMLAEADGDVGAAASAYADAAARWQRFGVVPEQGFALLGHGRCLLATSGRDRAAGALHGAREIFARLRATPALAEIDVLLSEDVAR